MSSQLSRAELLRRGAVGGATLAVSGAGLGAFAATARAAVPDADLAYLRLLVAAELLSLDYEGQALASGKLSGRSASLLKQLHRDDSAHYTGLAAMINSAGQVPATADDIDFSYPKGSYASHGSILKLGSTLAALSIGAYLGAVENLQTPELRGPIGQIAANEAQQASAFAQLLGHPLVGSAFAASLPIDDVSAALDRYES